MSELDDSESPPTRAFREAPADLPAEPLLSYNPSIIKIGEGAGEDQLLETVGRPFNPSEPEKTNQPSKTGVLKPGEASQAEALGFKMLRMVGRGGMGEVWEAVQRRLGRIVAVKRLRKHRGSDGSVIDGTRTVARMFQAEARISALLDHPNIVPVYDLGFDESGAPLLAMKMVSGTGWNFLLAGDFPELSVEEHLARHIPILAQLTQAISFAHSKGVIHRDLKPSQVMVGEYGEVLLLDWGLACMMGDQSSYPLEEGESVRYPSVESADNPAGTPAYMAPEQTESHARNVGPWTDIYLLGGILYQILTGLRPHPGETSDQAFRNASIGYFIPFSEAAIDREKPEELCHLALAALNPVPAERPTAKQFHDHLQDYLTGASRRRESVAITAKLKNEKALRTYAEFVDALGRLGQAQRLWPGNPDALEQRERIVEGYTRLALSTGDLTLARAQGERIIDVNVRAEILSEVDAAERRIAARRKRVVQLTVATCILLALVFLGGTFFTLQLKKAGEETERQLVITKAAKSAEGVAREKAQRESERAILLLADSLISQGRREEAVDELLRIPEASRFWEWEFVLTRALNDLWVSPFEYLAFSSSKNLAVGYEASRGLCLLRAESGEDLMQLAQGQLAEVVVAFSRNEGRLAYFNWAGKIQIVDTERKESVGEIETIPGAIPTTVEFSPDGTSIGIGYNTGEAELAEIATGKKTTLLKHFRFVQNIFWGKKAIVVASSDIVARHDVQGGNTRVIFYSAAVTGPFRVFKAEADAERRYFVCGYIFTKPLYALVDEGGLMTLDLSAESFAFSKKRPWLVISTSEIGKRVVIWDLEQNRPIDFRFGVDTDFDRYRQGRLMGTTVRAVDLSADETLAMIINDSDIQIRNFPDFGSIVDKGAVPSAGIKNAYLTPEGNSYWAVRRDGRTALRPLGTTYVGTNLPGNVSSFGANDAYTAVIRESSFEQRDTQTGEVIFTGGNLYNLYMGSPTSEDLKTIYLPGYRGGEFTIEKSERLSGKMLAKFVWEEEVGLVVIDPDKATILVVAPTGRELSRWSLAGSKQELLWRREIPESEPAIVRAAYSRSRDKIILLMQKGVLALRDCATGDELKSLVAHEGGFAMLAHLRDFNVFITGGTDGALLFSDNETLEEVRRLKFDFVPADIAMSKDGKRLLASPNEGAPVVLDLSTKKEIVRLARTTFPMSNARFIAEDSRILAHAGGQARLWDPNTGIEVFNIDEGFGEISGDSRSVIFKESLFDGTLLQLVPSKSGDFNAGESKEFRELLELWMIDRYKRWRIQQVRGRIPNTFLEVRNLAGTISGPNRDLLFRYIRGAASNVGNTRVSKEVADICSTVAMSLPTDGDFTFLHAWAEDLLTMIGGMDPTVWDGTASRVAIVSAASRGIQHDEGVRTYYDDIYFPTEIIRTFEAAAHAYLARGEREQAVQILRRSSAIRQLAGFVDGETDELLESLNAPRPAPPSPEIAYGPHCAAPPWVTSRVEAIPVELSPEERWNRVVQIKEEYKKVALEYLSATPPLDWRAEIQRMINSPEWKGLPPETTNREFFEYAMKRLEPAYYDGKTKAEAIEAEAQRLDELFRFKTAPVN